MQAAAKARLRSKDPWSATKVMKGMAGGPLDRTSRRCAAACRSKPPRSFVPIAAMCRIPSDASSSRRQASAAAIGTALVQYEPVKKTRVAASRSGSHPTQAAIGCPLPSALQ